MVINELLLFILVSFPTVDSCSLPSMSSSRSSQSAVSKSNNNDEKIADELSLESSSFRIVDASSSDNNKNKQTPPPQYATPIPSSPVTSTCGHNRFYNTADTPGVGIVGGVNASYGQYPWITRLRIKTKTASYLCGGSIIGERWIITAAHCVVSAVTTPESVTAIIADWDAQTTDSYEYSTAMTQIVVHPSYSSNTEDYDYALLRTAISLNFTANWYMQKICLPVATCSNDECAPSTVAYIAGWGTTAGRGVTARFLQSAYVAIASPGDCQSSYGTSRITDRMICAGYFSGGVDTCSGDSGGPLMTTSGGKYTLCGITSWGKGCAQPGYYGVYSRVCKAVDWIKVTTGM